MTPWTARTIAHTHTITQTHTPQVLAQELIKEDVIPLLLQHFPALHFEARKEMVRVFSDLAYHNWAGALVNHVFY